ncbi:hypothetical protein B0H14DRAFT_2566637 [Mycena olivaceomarginata]|nr:hypothetical protein B0H14DRAFT_2566637 [Mycena olivaceomarginata]
MVIKFIDDRYSRPTERLSAVQNLSLTDSGAPFATLDQLKFFLLKPAPVQLDQLFELEPGDVQLILRRLHSVLDVPSDADQRRSLNIHLGVGHAINISRAVLKALLYDNHSATRAWRLTANDFIKCITSIPPSAELVPLIQPVNPDFLWRKKVPYGFGKRVQQFLIWLKALQPIPEDLILRWEEYHFMVLWDASDDLDLCKFIRQEGTSGILLLSPPMLPVLQTKLSGSLLVSLEHCRQFVARYPGFAPIRT